MAKYNKAHALSQYVSDLEEERKRRQRLQTSLDEHKQSSTTSNTTTVSTKPIAPIRTDTQYIANRILGGQTIEQRYAPFLNVQDRPTTSTDLFNKLKTENEEKLKQQNQNKETDWIDSLKDGYNFGDITKTVLGTVGFGEHSRNNKPIEVDTKAIENMYKNYTEEQLIKEQKNIQNKILTYSKNGVKSPKNKDGKYTLSGVLSMASNENNEKLRNDPEYITLNQIDDVLTEMIQNTRIKNKKYDKGFAGFAEKSTDVLVGGMAKGARGIEGTVKKIIGKEDTISEKTYMEKYSDKAMSEANGKVEKALLEMQGSIGQMVPQMVVPAGKVSTIVGFANYGGSAYNEAKEQGYTEEQATRYGIVNGTLEMALNKVLPSFKVGGKNIYGKTATDNLMKKIMTKTLGNEAFKRWIIDASGEFTEEYLQEFLDPIVREALLEENNGVGIINGEDASDIASNIASYTAKNFFSKENFRAGLLGALNSGLMGAPSAFQANTYTKTTGRSSETGLTQNEQAVIDNIVENRVEELKKNKDKVTKKDISKIEQEVRQDLERGYIETSEIERALSNEEWAKHDKVVKQKEKLENKIKELESKTPQDYKTMGELNSSNEELSRLKEQLSSIDTDTTRGELNSAMQGKLTDNDTLLQRAYGEEIEKNNAYQFDKNEKLTEQTKKINEDIEKLGLNNNIKTRDTIDLIKKLSNETGRQYRLIDNNSTEMEKVEGKNVDGFVRNGEVFINVDSENLINRILGHETTHLFEGTEDYTKLQNAAIEYAKTKGEYDNRKSSLEEVYKDIKDANIENELTSDLVGDYLFSDIEFVRSLSTEQPNIFKKMYNYVKHLYNMATAGSKEARQLEQLKYNFEKVYRENNQSKANNDTKYGLFTKNKETNKIEILDKNNMVDLGYSDELKQEINRKTKKANKNKENVSYVSTDILVKHLKSGGAKEIDTTQKLIDSIKENGITTPIQVTIDASGNAEIYNGNHRLYIAKRMGLDSVPVEFINVNQAEIKNFLVENGIDSIYNENIGDENVIDGRYRFSSTEKQSVKESKTSDIKRDKNQRRTSKNEGISLGISQMYERSSNNSRVDRDEGLYNTNVKARRRGSNQKTNGELESSFSNTTKYSISNKDSEGRTLSKEQQEYFKDSKVVDRDGNLMVMYHGTESNVGLPENERFTIFDRDRAGSHGSYYGSGFYFTPYSETAQDYAKSRGDVYETYLNMTNPYIPSADTINKDGSVTFAPTFYEDFENRFKEQLPQYWNDENTNKGRVVRDILQDNGYDGIINGETYVVFESNQIKNVDNTSPSSSPDIRYSISDKGELQDNKGNKVKIETSDVGNTGTLMAMHNLGENKLNGILDLDGIPVPSIAITNPEIVNHTQFGEGSLIFSKNTIDPAIKENEVYDRDVWSPTFPTIEYDVNVKDLNKVRNIVGGYGNEYLSGANSKLNNIEEIINRNGYEGLKDDLKDNKDFKYVYYKTLNPNFEIFTKTDTNDVSTRYSNEFLQEFINEYGKEIPNWGSIEDNQRKEIVEKFKEKWIPVLEQKRDSIIEEENKKENPRMFIIGMANSTVESNLEWLNSLGGQDKLIENLNEIQRTGGTKEVNDYQKTNDYINDNINQEDYEKWIDDNFKSIVGKKGIYNGKEYLTPQGNRRTFNQLHEDYNLKNLVKELTKQSTVAGESGFGAGQNFGTLQAKMSNKFNSIEDIKNAENRIQYDENSKELIDSYSNEIYEYMNQLREYSYYKDNNYFYGDNAGYALNDFADYKTQNIDNLKKALEKNGINSKEVPTELLNNIVNSINELKNIPTDYFEAKPQRAVGLDEIEMAVIPNNWSAETKQRLTDKGIKYTEYDPSIEGDRQRVINQYDNLKFMLSNRNNIASISNNDIRARDMLLPRQQEIQKAIAPIQEENKVLKQEVETLKKEVRDIQENNAISYEDFEEYNKRIAPLLEEQEAPPEIEQVYDNLKDTTRMPKKELKLLSKNIKDTLGLTNKQKLDLEEIIQDYSTSETATREDLYNEIKQRYGKQAIITEYEDIRNVQRKIKSMKLDVSDNIRHDIADYNMLRQKNFVKLSFSRNGQPVDSVYQELSSEYPNYFPSNIYNETDQFLKIVDVANLENKSVEELNLDDNYIRETSDYIYESILDSKQDAVKKAVEKISKESLQGELKAPLPVSFDTSDIDANNAVDEVRLMEHKARKKSQVDKGNGKRAPFDWSTFEEVGRKLRAGEDANSIAELNKLDAETANKQIEEQKKLKPKNESTLKKSLTYGQYLFTNRNVEIDNYAKETGNHNIQVLADHINNIQGEITTNINNSQTDNNGNTIGKSITNIFSQADKAGLSEAFNDYLFHLSNIERHKWGKGSQVPGIDSSILIEEYEKTYPEMKKWAKEVNKYNKNLLYKQADAGLITKELADSLSEMYEFYVPFMENLEGEYTPDKTNSIKTRSTVKRAKGGASRNLLSFEDAMIRQTESAITQIRKNQLYQEIVKTKENANIDFESNTNPDIHDNGLFSDNGKYYLTAYVDGKATQVEIDKSLYHGLAQEGNQRIRQAEQKLSPITKPLQATSNIRRNILTTWNPSFMVTNMLKDIQDAPLNSKYAKDMVKNYPRALKEISTGKGKHLEAFLNMYGQANLRGDYNLDSGLSDITKLAENNKNGKGMKFSKDLLKKIPQINEMIEMAPRYAEYLASIENGCSQMEALYNAREVTTNFGRGGIITKALNRNGFTFLNASVQGMSKLVRNFSGENGGRAVVGCIAKATALGIAPALLNALLFGDDDDYEALPDYIKDNYYLIKTSDKGFIRIPKGRMMSIFGSAARRTLEGIQGRENPYEGYLSNAYNQVGVQNPSESNIFAPLIQAKNNKTWYGTDLVPKRLQTNKEDGTKIPAKDQYDASTDKMSIWLGEKLNISPYKINYVIDQYSGGIGDIILPMMTEEAQSGSDSATGKMVAPLKDKFTADSITDNKYVTNFYSKLEELGEKKNATGSKKDEMSYNYMRNISFEMGSLYAEMRKVQADTTLKDSKKYAKVQNIKAEINRLAEEGMKGYKDVETYDNYARVGDRELYKYQSKDGKTGWSDSSGMYADDINNLGLSIKEKDTYYTTKMEMSNVANKFKEDEGAEKYRAVLKTIRNSKLPSDAKYELYNSWYGKSDETSSIVQGLGISANDYLKFKTADLSSTKNRNGYAIRGSKADKVISYLNKTKLSKGQKAVLYRLAFNYKGNYSSSRYSNAYNEEIVRYIDNSSLTYDESVDALKKLGFKVSKDGTVKWD